MGDALPARDTPPSEAGFDALRGVVVGGSAVVARLPGLVCVAAGDAAAVRTLLDLCAAASGPAPGRPLGRSLARWLAGPQAPPDDLAFGTVAAADDRVAVFLYGAVGVQVSGTGEALSGAEAATWTDRLLPHTAGPLVLALDRAAVPPDVGGRVHDLRTGVVPGAGVALLPPETGNTGAGNTGAGPSTAGHAAPEAAPPEAAPPEVAPPPADVAPVRPFRSALIDGERDAEPARPPLDGGGAPAALLREERTTPAGSGGTDPVTERSRDPVARGYLCARGHLNDPRSHFCVLCGIRMNERTGVLTTGPRPPLGLLVFDDGRTYSVDAPYVVGRTPEADERVRGGEVRALPVEDPGGTISRVHAEIRLHDWDVMLVDTGSLNGTYVVPPSGSVWEQVPGQWPHRLVPGTRVRLGHHRTFVFESPSGVR